MGLNAATVAEQLSVLSAFMRPSPAAIFNLEIDEPTMVCFNATTEAATTNDAARGDGQKTEERAVAANGQNHCHNVNDISVALQRMMTSLLSCQVLAEVKRALHHDM